jgi:hypothetical protein
MWHMRQIRVVIGYFHFIQDTHTSNNAGRIKTRGKQDVILKANLA